MSIYYHEFQVGFNFWFILVPAALAAMYFIGKHNVHLKNGRRFRRYSDRFYRFLSAVIGILTMVLIVAESGNGIVQMFDNCLAYNEDPAWSVICATFAVGAVITCEVFACFRFAKLGESRKRQELIARQHRANHHASNVVEIPAIRQSKTRKEISAM